MNRSQVDITLARFCGSFIFFAEDATPVQPTKAAFNLPALRLDDKFALSCGALDNIDDDAKPALGKFDQPALVALIHKDSLQPWEAFFGFMKNVLGTITRVYLD